MKTLSRLAFVVVLGALYAGSALAAESAFYKGKTLTVLINFAAGGPTDIEGRLVARFIGKHIPGQPAVVVVNQPAVRRPIWNLLEPYLPEVVVLSYQDLVPELSPQPVSVVMSGE